MAALEALCFAAAEPLGPARLAGILGVRPSDVKDLAGKLNTQYEEHGHGLRIEQVAGGWQLVTQPGPGAHPAAAARTGQGRPAFAAALETLAIVAYRQPILKADIESIRGVRRRPPPADAARARSGTGRRTTRVARQPLAVRHHPAHSWTLRTQHTQGSAPPGRPAGNSLRWDRRSERNGGGTVMAAKQKQHEKLMIVILVGLTLPAFGLPAAAFLAAARGPRRRSRSTATRSPRRSTTPTSGAGSTAPAARGTRGVVRIQGPPRPPGAAARSAGRRRERLRR